RMPGTVPFRCALFSARAQTTLPVTLSTEVQPGRAMFTATGMPTGNTSLVSIKRPPAEMLWITQGEDRSVTFKCADTSRACTRGYFLLSAPEAIRSNERLSTVAADRHGTGRRLGLRLERRSIAPNCAGVTPVRIQAVR